MAGASNIAGAGENPVGINVTPMVDVIFCLCLFFMCSFHFKQVEGKLDTWLPRDHGGFEGLDRFDATTVVVAMAWRSGSVELRIVGLAPEADPGRLVAELLRLEAEVVGRAAASTWRVVIQAEPDVPWESVVQLLDLCRGRGLRGVELGAPSREL